MTQQHPTIEERPPKPWRLNLAALAILLLAMTLQFYGLAADSMWGDEIFTAIFAAQSPAETIAFTASDIHPPLYYLLAGSLSHTSLWPEGTPGVTTDWLWRWPSALAAVLAVAFTYRLGLSVANRQVGLLAALFLTTAPVAVKYGQEARMHALFMALSVGATLVLALALKTGRRRNWLGFTFLTILNLYTMYFAFIIIAVQGVWVLVQNKRPSALRLFAMAVTAALLAYLPWWPILIRLLAFRANVGAVEGGVGAPLAFLLKAIQAIGPFGGSAWLFLGLYLLGLLAAWQWRRSLAALGGCWLLPPLLLPIFLGDSRALQLRYAFILPVYLIMVALAVVWLGRLFAKSIRRWVVPLVALGLTGLSLVSTTTVYQQLKPDWRGAAQFVSAQAKAGDVVMTGPLWDDGRFFGYYYPRPEQVMSPPLVVSQLPGLAADMAVSEGRFWLVTRADSTRLKRFEPHEFRGVTVLVQTEPNYDPVGITTTSAEFCQQAAQAAYDWAAAMEAGGVLNPDPRSSQAGAYYCQGEVYELAGNYEEALKAYEKMVAAFPGWSGGYATLAKTYVAVDNLPAAVDAFAEAVRYNPAWQGPQADAAFALAAQSKWQEAIALYQEIINE